MQKGTSFLRSDESGHMHLKVIISEPDPEGMVLVVSVSSVPETRRYDDSCILEAGCHGFIRHKSYVSYKFALELNNVKLVQESFRGNLTMKENVPPDVLKRIQAGAKNSPFLPKRLRKFFAYF